MDNWWSTGVGSGTMAWVRVTWVRSSRIDKRHNTVELRRFAVGPRRPAIRVELGQRPVDLVPCRLGAHEDVHGAPDAWVVV